MGIYQPTYQQQAQEEMIEAAMPSNPLDGLTVKDTPTRSQQRSGKPPSAKQLNLILRLLGEKDLTGIELPEDRSATGLEQALTGGWEGTASKLIDSLFNAPRTEDRPVAEEAPEGIHYFEGDVYKVQVAVHGSGRKYVKKLDRDGDGWAYLGRGELFRSLSADTLMTLEDAQEFGRLYGMCCRCGATLTDEDSIAAGIGPVCAQSF